MSATRAHVADAHLRPVGVHAQQDVAELLRRGQARRPDDARADRLARRSRQSTDRAHGNLHVLRADGGDHVAGGEAVVVELRGIEPDAHRILRTEHRDVADARRAIQRIEDVRRDVVGQVLVAHAAVGGDEAHHHEEVARRFVHPDAGLLDFLRQQRHGGLQLVLHLHLRGVGHRALRERQRDRPRMPSELASEVMYVRLSMPFSACSMTWITVSCTVCAEAPG